MGALSHSLKVEKLTKRYADATAVNNVSLNVEQGKFVTLLGPSGSGKTTILMSVAGFVAPTSGKILLDNRDITALPAEHRNFGMVFQGYALFPHMTVEENIWFPLRVRGKSFANSKKAIHNVLELVQLGAHSRRLPGELSGGQQQRVALARAIVFEPHLLLLDEPLSALDKGLRAELQWEISSLHRRLGSTFINVTHDQEEALSMSDEIVIMREGRVEQTGNPTMLYEHPQTRFVASFLGESNFIRGMVDAVEGDRFRYSIENRSFLQAGAPTGKMSDGTVLLALRPEKIKVGLEPLNMPNSVEGSIADFKYFGSTFFLQIVTRSLGRIMVKVPAMNTGFTPGIDADVWVGWTPDDAVAVRES